MEKWTIDVHDPYKPITYDTETYHTEQEAEKAAKNLVIRYPKCLVIGTYQDSNGKKYGFNPNCQYDEVGRSWY